MIVAIIDTDDTQLTDSTVDSNYCKGTGWDIIDTSFTISNSGYFKYEYEPIEFDESREGWCNPRKIALPIIYVQSKIYQRIRGQLPRKMRRD